MINFDLPLSVSDVRHALSSAPGCVQAESVKSIAVKGAKRIAQKCQLRRAHREGDKGRAMGASESLCVDCSRDRSGHVQANYLDPGAKSFDQVLSIMTVVVQAPHQKSAKSARTPIHAHTRRGIVSTARVQDVLPAA